MRSLILLLAATASLWSLTIDVAIERALKASPTLKKAQSDINYAGYTEKEAEAAFHPTLSAGFEWKDVDKITAFGYTPSHSYNLTAKYNLFNGMTDYHTLKAERRQSEASRLLYKAKASDLRLQVIHAYAGYLNAEKAVRTQQKALTSLERAYKDTKLRFEQGVVAKNELLLIDVDRLNAKQAVVAAESNLRRAHSNLNRVMGGSLQPDESIKGFKKKFKKPAPFNTLLKNAYAKRSELKALYKTKESLGERYKATRGVYLPSIDVGANYIVNDREYGSDFGIIQHKENFQVTVSATWNLYSGGAQEAQRLKALEQVNKQNSDIELMKLDLRYQIRDAYEIYRTAQSALNVAVHAKKSAEENYRITKERHHLGDVDTLSLLKARANLTAAHNAYYNAYYNLHVALATLKRVSGE